MEQLDNSEIHVSENRHGKTMEIKIPASLCFSPIIRDIVGSIIQNETQFSSKWKYRVQLMADELINNAIEHGSNPSSNIRILITLYDSNDIEVIVEDSGAGINKIDASELMEKIRTNRENMLKNPLSNKSIRGRGLAMIVLSWSDEFEYTNNSSGGLTARIFKKYTEEVSEKKQGQEDDVVSNLGKIQIETSIF